MARSCGVRYGLAMHRAPIFVVLAVAWACQGPPGDVAPDDPPDDEFEVPSFPAEILCPDPLEPLPDRALPKNIIVLLGDGMGPMQIEAGRIHHGGPLAWDDLPGPVYLNTDSLTTDRDTEPDPTPTDSAASATAIATGTRVVNGAVSLDESGQPLTTVLEMAQAEGKAVGVVTTSYLHDASPMAFATHVASRDLYPSIAQQLLTVSRPDVVMGGALDLFTANDGEYTTMARDAGYHIVHDESELAAWDPATEPMLLGLFESSHDSLADALYRWATTPVAARDETSTDPLLADMAARALDRLSRDEDGFFLFIENEQIDTLGHISILERDLALTGMPAEVAALAATTDVVLDWVAENSSFDDTLVVITADHECGFYELTDDELTNAYFFSITHTRQPVALWAKGPGAENLDSLCRVSDVHHLLTGQLPAGGRAIALP